MEESQTSGSSSVGPGTGNADHYTQAMIEAPMNPDPSEMQD